MKCSHCGFENKEGASFCIYCGTNFDSTFVCPSCGEILEVGTKVCPHCKTKIPYESLSPLSKDEMMRESRRKHLHPRFEYIFNLVAGGVYVLAILFLVFALIKGGDSYIINRLTLGRGIIVTEMINKIELSLERTMVWFEEIFNLVFFAMHLIAFVGSLGFALVNQYKTIRDRKDFEAEKYFSITLCSLLLLGVNSMQYSGYVMEPLFYVLVGYLALFIAIVFIYRTYYSYKKGRTLRLLEKVVFSFSFYLLIGVLISNLVPSYLAINSVGFATNRDVYLNIVLLLSHFTNDNEFITLLIVEHFNQLFIEILYFLAATQAIYFAFHFAHISEEKKTFKVPYYSVSVFLSIVAIFSFTLSLLTGYLFSNRFYESNQFLFPLISTIDLGLLIAHFIVIAVSLTFTKINLKYDKILLKKSSQKE